VRVRLLEVKAQGDGVECDKAANEQHCPDEQHQSQRHLADDEKRKGLALAQAGAGTAVVFLERRIQVSARRCERRQEP